MHVAFLAVPAPPARNSALSMRHRPASRRSGHLAACVHLSTRCWPSSAGATVENGSARKPVLAVPPPSPQRALLPGKCERLDTLACAALLRVLLINGDDEAMDIDPQFFMLRICCNRIAQCICFGVYIYSCF
jgi:hypothetical protein